MISSTLTITKTETKITCAKHGDGVLAEVVLKSTSGFNHHLHVCSRCADEAIEQYHGPNKCVDCDVDVERNNGIEKDGILVPMCRACVAKYLVVK